MNMRYQSLLWAFSWMVFFGAGYMLGNEKADHISDTPVFDAKGEPESAEETLRDTSITRKPRILNAEESATIDLFEAAAPSVAFINTSNYRQNYWTSDISEIPRGSGNESAVQAMRFLVRFNPRLVGSVLSGTAGRHADINLHLFADAPEEISLFLMESNIPFHASHKRVRLNRDEWQDYPSFEFFAGDCPVDLVVFPREGRREAPRSPVDGRPMQRAGQEEVEALLSDSLP